MKHRYIVLKISVNGIRSDVVEQVGPTFQERYDAVELCAEKVANFYGHETVEGIGSTIMDTINRDGEYIAPRYSKNGEYVIWKVMDISFK